MLRLRGDGKSVHLLLDVLRVEVVRAVEVVR